MNTIPLVGKIVIALVVLGLFIFFSDVSGIRSIRDRIIKMMSPVMLVSVGSFSDEEERLLQKDRQRLRALQLELGALEKENEEFREAFAMSPRVAPERLRGAGVVRYGNEFGKEFLILNRGREHGFSEGDIVLSAEQLFLGSIQEIGEKTAIVSIASNPGETFDVELLPLGTQALAKGLGARTFSLELVSVDVPLLIGDLVALPRRGVGPFLVGEVVRSEEGRSVVFQEVRATLSAHPERIEKVFVIISQGTQ